MNRRSFAKLFAFIGLTSLLPRKVYGSNAEGIEMYEVQGKRIFPLMSNNGFFTSDVCAFPMLITGKSVLIFGYYSPISYRIAEREEYVTRIEHDSKAMFAEALRRKTSIVDRKDGDMMPKHGEIVRFRSA